MNTVQKLLGEKYKVENTKLGSGRYGYVYKGVKKSNKETVAIKHIDIQNEDYGIPQTALREISYLKNLSHCKHIIQLLDFKAVADPEDGKDYVFMVFEYMHTDLRNYIKEYTDKEKCVPPEIIKRLMFHLLIGMVEYTNHGYLHRDLKPANLLINKSNPDKPILKIGDFGLAKSIGVPIRENLTPEICTLSYRPPQLLMGETKYATEVDVWSAGCIFAELCLGTPLFYGDSGFSSLLEIFKILGKPPPIDTAKYEFPRYLQKLPAFEKSELHDLFENLDEEGIDLLSKMWEFEPDQRISALDALHHPYFKDAEENEKKANKKFEEEVKSELVANIELETNENVDNIEGIENITPGELKVEVKKIEEFKADKNELKIEEIRNKYRIKTRSSVRRKMEASRIPVYTSKDINPEVIKENSEEGKI